MSNIVRVGAYAYQKSQVVALEDAETRAQMGLDADRWSVVGADDDSDDSDGSEDAFGADHRHQGDERVLNAGRAM